MENKDIIDAKRAENINTILIKEDLSQRQLAKAIGMAPENLNRIINGRMSLTEKTARAIIEKFPNYRLEWLLGYDDYMTSSDLFYDVWKQANEANTTMTSAIFDLAQLSGFTVEPTEQQPDRSIESILRAIKTGWTFSRDGKSVSLSLEDLNDFGNELCDYVEMRLKRMMK